MNFYSLHNHTYASNIRFLDSINKPKDMIDKAINLGFKGMAFTDHESLSAAVDIIKERDRIKKDNPDFKIIFGNEIYLIDETEVKNTTKYYHFILLAKDKEGWDQLRELSSFAWENSYVERGQVRVPTTYQKIEEVIGKNPGHIFASSACVGGYLPTMILEHNVPEANKFIRWCIEVFGQNNFALELQPSDNEEQLVVNKTLIKLAHYYKLPFIVTTDSHYLDKEDFKIHSAFLNSKQTSDRETDKFYRFTYVMTEEEMIQHLVLDGKGISEEDAKTAIDNTKLIGESIEEFDFRHDTIVPRVKIPPFTLNNSLYHKGYPITDKFYESDDDQDRYLIYQIEQGLLNKKIVLDKEKQERIEYELDILDYISTRLGQSLSAYLNLTVNIVDLAWQVSLVGCGRGSACGFFINYLIGVTQANPLIYDLVPWRFLNKERVELADIDEDFQPEKNDDIIKILRDAYGEDNVLNCATFKTESLKSAILSCARGLGINNDDAQALAAIIPSHRGHTYTLKECLDGDEEKGYVPVENFKEKFKAYPGLFEAVQKIEGLPTNASIHASALYVFNNGYLAQNSLMRAPNKTKITAFDMHDSDDMGALKMDVLKTDAQSKMAKCLELMLKDGQIEWKGSLRKTYDEYLHPDVLDYTNPIMWEKMSNGSIQNLFQMDSPVGSIAMKKARPENVRQLAEVNSIMRLQSDSGEQPIDRYVRFRNDINQWYLEMVEEGLNSKEIKVLEKYLLQSNGVSGSQEVMMQILMDSEISGFTLGEANSARKAVSKKIAAKIVQLKKDYFEKCKNLGTREAFSHYVWKYCIEPQLGYSFSLNHTLPYSIIAVQEANLATRWNPLYWQCACLCVNSGNYVGDMGEDSEGDTEKEEQGNIEVDLKDEQKVKKVAPNYTKIGKAINDMQLSGVKIELPDINTSQEDFYPDVKNNAILYSLSAISGVSDSLYEKIVSNRPYTSLEDFITKVEPTTSEMFCLIECGCFNKLLNKTTEQIVYLYAQKLAEENCPLKDKINATDLKKIVSLGYEPEQFNTEIRVLKYKMYIDKNQKDTPNKRYVLTDETCKKFFSVYISDKLNMDKSEYYYLPNDAIGVKITAFEKAYNAIMQPLYQYLNSPDGLKKVQSIRKDNFLEELRNKYYTGTSADWQFKNMCFYHEKPAIYSVNKAMYNIVNFNDLPENSENKKIVAVAGTVVGANNGKHIVSLLTDTGVVEVKFYAEAYVKYNQKISVVDPKTNKKTVLDDSWFKRGSNIIVYGSRRENTFTARNFKAEHGYYRMVGLIEQINLDGSANIRYNRNKK